MPFSVGVFGEEVHFLFFFTGEKHVSSVTFFLRVGNFWVLMETCDVLWSNHSKVPIGVAQLILLVLIPESRIV